MHDKDVRGKDIPKTAVIGASGFLGRYFLSAYRMVYPDCVGTAREAAKENGKLSFLDLRNPDIRPLCLSRSGHKEALILAAVTKVDTCENERIATRKVNVDGTLELIRQLVEEGIKPIFFSSDYVFDGEKGAYSDDAPINPKTEYGRQKAAVEAGIKSAAKSGFLTVRLSKVFSLNREDRTLLDEMAHVLSSGGIVQAAHDQIFCPTLISDIINAVTWLQVQGATGTINVCSPEIWSRYDLAVSLSSAMGFDMSKVRKLSLDEIIDGKKRPKNTSMVPSVLLKSGVSFSSIGGCIKSAAGNWIKMSV